MRSKTRLTLKSSIVKSVSNYHHSLPLDFVEKAINCEYVLKTWFPSQLKCKRAYPPRERPWMWIKTFQIARAAGDGRQDDAHTEKLHNFVDAMTAFPEWAKGSK